ncbi:pancreatic lipase-related protein 2-like [Gigantopelta aegis]|uniref:pancreatic lipase-related protein 2-like n=1 Tax=Gigantopelta aegis TaxID=1735272 RepID=UPI001B88BE34|nr:pancreatic lipase-related protein 2-like [Gigantopelta aegis]
MFAGLGAYAPPQPHATKPDHKTPGHQNTTPLNVVVTTKTTPVAKTTTSKATVTVTTASPTTFKPTPNPRVNKTVCYDYIGCFDNFPPFDNANLDLPKSPEYIGTRFLLFTRLNRNNSDFQLLNYTIEDSVSSSHFNPKVPTKFILHGFSQNGTTSWVLGIKDEFLKSWDMNIVVVDWGNGAKFPDYPQAVANTRVVATEMRLIVEMMLKDGAKLSDVHFLGHSLGAHTSGYTGFLLSGQVGRISGMDPAEPNYGHLAEVVRLDKSDAKFIDITHTNGAPIFSGGAGSKQQMGHVDFYVNGGEKQPGCHNGIGGALTSLLSGGNLIKAVACSHSRSHNIYWESINTPCPFTSYPCRSYDEFEKGNCLTCGKQGCSQMGYYSDQYQARGKLYLNTRAQSKYCGYNYNVKLTMGSSLKDTSGKVQIELIGTFGSSGKIDATGSGNTDLKKSMTYSHVVVSPVEVGDIRAIIIKYIKKTGFWFGSGEDQAVFDKVFVKSGESGDNFVFCLNGKTLTHNKAVRVAHTQRSTCT